MGLKWDLSGNGAACCDASCVALPVASGARGARSSGRASAAGRASASDRRPGQCRGARSSGQCRRPGQRRAARRPGQCRGARSSGQCRRPGRCRRPGQCRTNDAGFGLFVCLFVCLLVMFCLFVCRCGRCGWTSTGWATCRCEAPRVLRGTLSTLKYSERCGVLRVLSARAWTPEGGHSFVRGAPP